MHCINSKDRHLDPVTEEGMELLRFLLKIIKSKDKMCVVNYHRLISSMVKQSRAIL